MPANEIHYSLIQKSYGLGAKSQSDRWLKTQTKNFLAVFNAEPNQDFENVRAYRFDSGKWAIIDDELRRLEIRHAQSISIQFHITQTETPSNSYLVQIMTYPKMETAGPLILLLGLLALISALIITLIAASSVPITTPLAMVGGILLVIGITMSLATHHCQKRLDNTPFNKEYDVTMEQLGHPKTKKMVSSDLKERLIARFFQAEKKGNSGVIEELSDVEEYTP